MNINAKIFANPDIPDVEKGSFIFASVMVYVYRTGIKFDNIFMFSQHDSYKEKKYIFFPIRLVDKTLAVHNSHLIYEGMFIYAVFQFNLDYYNVDFDLYKAYGGSSLVHSCNFPEDNPTNLVKLENVNMYFSKGIVLITESEYR